MYHEHLRQPGQGGTLPCAQIWWQSGTGYLIHSGKLHVGCLCCPANSQGGSAHTHGNLLRDSTISDRAGKRDAAREDGEQRPSPSKARAVICARQPFGDSVTNPLDMLLEGAADFNTRTLNIRRQALERATHTQIADALLAEIEINEDLDPFRAMFGTQSQNAGMKLVETCDHGLAERRILGSKMAIKRAGGDICLLGQPVNTDAAIAPRYRSAISKKSR